MVDVLTEQVGCVDITPCWFVCLFVCLFVCSKCVPVVNALMVTWRSSLLTTGTPCVLCVYSKCAGVDTLLLLFGRVVPEVIFQEIEASPSQVDSPSSPLTPSHPHTLIPSHLHSLSGKTAGTTSMSCRSSSSSETWRVSEG